jgi:acyl-CoA reductase-like NAD-dependent aldehyde dehydrogenase
VRVIDPATEEEIAVVEAGSPDEVVAQAKRAFEPWRRVSPGDRAKLLRRFASVVDSHIEELAQLEVRNAGHTIGNARWEAGNVRDLLDYYSGAPERLCGRQIPVAGGWDVTFHEPLGVVGVIVPWNFPMPIAGWGFAPALAAGNTVVLKPAELTPLTALRLGELALEAGLPEGVLNILPGHGSEVGRALVAHPDVRKICFTGSVEVGKQIMAACAADLTRVTLELGGKSATVLFADADLGKAAAALPGAVFDNAGQDCCARSRLLVQRPVYDEFLALLEPHVLGWECGSSSSADMGPLISASQREHVASYVDNPLIQGEVPTGKGFWFPATVLEASARDRHWREGGLRAGVVGHAFRHRGGGGAARQRHAVRAVRLHLDA